MASRDVVLQRVGNGIPDSVQYHFSRLLTFSASPPMITIFHIIGGYLSVILTDAPLFACHFKMTLNVLDVLHTHDLCDRSDLLYNNHVPSKLSLHSLAPTHYACLQAGYFIRCVLRCLDSCRVQLDLFLLPSVLTALAACVNETLSIATGVRNLFGDFMRTNRDEWQSHKNYQ